MIKNFYDKSLTEIESFFCDITITSINYVTWSTSVIVSLLALTTIIFSYYNERQIFKSNNLSREIEDSLSNNGNITNQIIGKTEELFYVLSNQSTYRWTLRFFFLIAYLCGFLWLTSGIGYILNQINPSFSDLIIISFSLLTVILTFTMLPIILVHFNSNPPIAVDSKNRVSLMAFLRYFKTISITPGNKLFQFIVNPSLEINANKFKICLRQNIPVSDVNYTYQFVNTDNVIQILSINKDKSNKYSEYYIKSKNKYENTHLGLFKQLRDSRDQYLYVSSSNNKKLITYKLKIDKKNDESFTLFITNPYRISKDDQVSRVSKDKYNLQSFSSNPTKKYKIKEIKE